MRAVSLTFDNLGEAAELEMGALPADAAAAADTGRPRPRWCQRCSTELAERGLTATFFVEGAERGALSRVAEEDRCGRP